MTDERPTPTRREALTDDAGRTCPYCRFALKQGATIIECGGCHAPHHDDCWQDNGGCAVMGCKGGPGAGPTRTPVSDAPPAVPAARARPAVAPRSMPADMPPGPGQPPPPVAAPSGSRWRATPALTASLLVLVLAVAGGATALVVANQRKAAPQADPVVSVPDAGRPSAPAQPPVPPPPPPPTAADPLADVDEATMRDDIARILLAHHRAIVNGDYRTAWLLTSTRYRAKKVRELGSFGGWARGQADLAKHLDPSGLRVSIQDVDHRTGVATVNVTGMGWSEAGSPCSTWSGVTWAKFERGNWRYEPGYSISDQRRRVWEPRQSELLGVGC